MLETLYNDYKDDNLMVLSAWSENELGQTPTVEDLQRWANGYNLSVPVIADASGNLGARFNGTSPTYVLLKPGMEIYMTRDYIKDDELQAILAAAAE